MEDNNAINTKNYRPVAINVLFWDRHPKNFKLDNNDLLMKTYRYLMHTTWKEEYQKQKSK